MEHSSSRASVTVFHVELRTVVGETGCRGQESRAAIGGYQHYRLTNPVPRSMHVISQVHGFTLLALTDL